MVVSAVLQTSFLGDMVLTTPLIARLAADGPVHVVATPANAGLLANHPSVTSVIVIDKRGADGGWRGVRRVSHLLRDTGAARAFLAQGSVRTALIARLAGVPERIGFSTSPGRWWYTRSVPFLKDRHHAERLWQLASPVPTDRDRSTPPPRMPAHVRPSLYPGARDEASVDTLLREYAVAAGEPLVVLAPGSVWATKRWPSYAALAATLTPLLEQHAARLVIIGGGNDRGLAKEIATAVHQVRPALPPIIDATGRLSLLASAALLGRARLLVSNDSAPLHLASAMNTPTIALFGPTVPAFGFGPLAEHSVILEQRSLPCRPCGAHGPQSCPLGHWRCMRELAVDVVRDAIEVGVTRA